MTDAQNTPELPVQKRSRFFWLRIAVTVLFGLLTVALVVLWVRSHQANDCISRVSTGFVPPAPQWSDLKVTGVGWGKGLLYAVRAPVYGHEIKPHGWRFNSRPLQLNYRFVTDVQQGSAPGSLRFLGWSPYPFYVRYLPTGFSFRSSGVSAPIWSLTTFSIAAVVLVWLPEILLRIPSLPRRFSLRAMLIVTTMLAAILGYLAWMSR